MLNFHSIELSQRNDRRNRRRVALRTLFHQVKEIGNNRYKRINSFVVGSLHWMEFHNTSTNGYLFNIRRSIDIFFLSPYFLSFVASASPRFHKKKEWKITYITVIYIFVIKFIRICTEENQDEIIRLSIKILIIECD